MSDESRNTIVHKKCSKGGVHEDIAKRVSCDESVHNDQKIKELKVLHCSDNAKSDLLNLESLKKLINTYDEIEKCDRIKDQSDDVQLVIQSSAQTRKSTPVKHFALLERGTPEGQEDPKRYSSTSSLSECGKNSSGKNSSTVTGERSCRVSHGKIHNGKDIFVKKFFKCIPPKCIQNYELPKDNSRVTKLYFKHIKSAELSDYSSMIKSLWDEVQRNISGKHETTSALKPLILKLIASTGACIYKVYKVLTVEGCPVLAVITSSSLCFVGYDASKDEFCIEFHCNFESLLAAIVGPFYQLVIVLNEEKRQFFINTGVSESVASDLICHLEVALRRWCIEEKKLFNFNVAQIYDLKCMNVFHDILPDNAFTRDEKLIAQYSVWLQEDYVEVLSSLGPEREGYLMTKIGVELSWKPAYVCLKGGVFYLFEKNSHRIPKFAIPLRSPIYKGCRIHSHFGRPHTFEIILEGHSTFNFGAADETEMMAWIRDLHLSSMTVSNWDTKDVEKVSPIISCFVTLSTNQILLYKFPNEILSRALLTDVSSFTKSSWPESYYCLLELNCREASEMGGDWVIYFVSEDNYKHFCAQFSDIADHMSIVSDFTNLNVLIKTFIACVNQKDKSLFSTAQLMQICSAEVPNRRR